MLTRIEIDGFKSFERFALDLRPFSVIVGPNATGKSNLFDALRLLSRLADADVAAALRELRGEPLELFRAKPNSDPTRRIELAAEFVLDRDVTDAFGQRHALKGTRARYEVGIEYRVRTSRSPERLVIRREEARLVPRKEDRLYGELKGTRQRAYAEWVPATTKKPDLITMKNTLDGDIIEVRQDGGQGRPRPMREASATFLSTVRTANEFLHLFALREELISLRFLQLDPTAVRRPSDLLADVELLPNGANLAAVLARIKAETANETSPNGVIADIRSDLAALVPGVMELDVKRNEEARQYQVFVTMRDQTRFSSHVLSDGTLRLIALLTVLHDPRRRGVLCFEEPENGIHEGRIEGLINLLRSHCTDLGERPEDGERLSQIIVNTHSPIVMKHLNADEIIAADMVMVADPGNRSSYRKTRMRTGVIDAPSLPLSDADKEQRLTRFEVDELLRRQEPA